MDYKILYLACPTVKHADQGIPSLPTQGSQLICFAAAVVAGEAFPQTQLQPQAFLPFEHACTTRAEFHRFDPRLQKHKQQAVRLTVLGEYFNPTTIYDGLELNFVSLAFGAVDLKSDSS